MKIIVVDHDAENRKNLIRALGAKGHGMLEAADGKEALALLPQKPDAVIVAANPADADVLTLCRQARHSDPSSYGYIIILSKSPAAKDAILWLESGADVIIDAPADPDRLAAQLKAGQRRMNGNRRHSPAKTVHEPERFTKAEDSTATKPDPEPEKRADSTDAAPRTVARKEGLTIKDTTKQDRVLAKIALSHKIVTKKDLAEAFTIQHREQRAGRKASLDVILRERGMATQEQIDDLLVATKRRLGKRFGAIAIQKGFATQEQIVHALNEQAAEYKRLHSCRRLGDILVSHSVITNEQCDLIWLEQEAVEVLPAEPERTDENQTAAPLPESEEDRAFSLTISADNMKALITVKRDAAETRGALKKIKALLAENGVRHGILPDDRITEFLEHPDEEHRSLVAAEGTPPITGTCASIRYYFETEYLSAGKINAEGDIDYRDRGERPRVAKGTVVAEKIPGQAGQSGMDILGNAIPPPELEEIPLLCDEGVLLSDNGLQIIAAIDGEPNLTKSGRISVFDELNINGDVDFSTGNIHFAGNINVKGAIRDGFRVTGGSISAGEIFGAEIEAAGDVMVGGGILGANILTEGNVTAKYIDRANIKSFGSVIVQKEVRDSKIRASGEFKSERGTIISSYVAARIGVQTKNIGTDVSEACKIQIGVDENVRKRIQAYGFRHAEKTEILEKLQSEYENKTRDMEELQGRIAELAQVQDRSDITRRDLSRQIAELKDQGETEELKRILLELQRLETASKEAEEQLSNCFVKQEQMEADAARSMSEIETIISGIEAIGNEKNAVLKWAEKNKAQAVLRTSGIICSGTRIHGRRAAMIVKEDVKNCKATEVKTDEPGDNWEIVITRG